MPDILESTCEEEAATEIRLYEPRDREAVRGICRATAYGGDGIGLIEAELFIDLMTRYFTDCSPEALWVAEEHGEVSGYLAGCLEERDFQRVQARRVVPAAVGAALKRGVLLRRQLWRLVASLPGFVAAGGLVASPHETRYPGHLHVNLLPAARGRSVGAGLVERFLAQARGRTVPGVRATIYNSNERACRFFERLGFLPLERRPAFKPPADGREWKTVYGREL
jgi:GNAT superfamily N-acetyltransferase